MSQAQLAGPPTDNAFVQNSIYHLRCIYISKKVTHCLLKIFSESSICLSFQLSQKLSWELVKHLLKFLKANSVSHSRKYMKNREGNSSMRLCRLERGHCAYKVSLGV